MPACPAHHLTVPGGVGTCPDCEAAAAAALVGTTVAGRFFVHQVLGRGGMADVYKATWLTADRPVALKVLRRSALGRDEVARRFEREAAAASRLRHPHSVEVLDFGTAEDGAPYLAMEFVPGRSLAQELAAEAPFPPARAVHVAEQVLEALAEAHALGIVHRDLKPANVMLDPLRDGTDFVKVVDFGIATLAEESGAELRLTQEGTVCGTPAYMSPEQIRGEPLDARADLYAVGVVLFEMLAGRPPFEARSPMAVAARHLTEPAPPLGALRPVPASLEAVVARALEKDRARRPASAVELRAALLAALPEPGAARPLHALPPTSVFSSADLVAPHPPPAGRRPAALALALAAAALTLAVAAPWAARRLRSGAQTAVAASPQPQPQPQPRPAPQPQPEQQPEQRPTTDLRPAPAPPVAQRRVRRVAEPSAPDPASPPRPRSEVTAHREPALEERRAPGPAAPAIRLVRSELNSVATPSAATGDGVLVVDADPWAVVTLNGQNLGETPKVVRLQAGAHRVRAAHPDLGVRDEVITVRAGERRTWNVVFGPASAAVAGP